jgi:ribosomal protein L3 glutamine methyltransferase
MSTILDELTTIRDWLRWAVSRFNEAGLAYGHGTSNALDEAAFLILHRLKLPIDQLEPWLDCTLTKPERGAVHELLMRRISTRKPAPYLTGEAWIGGQKFFVDERTIVPRSFIGELLGNDMGHIVPDAERITRVLDLCTGGGSLAILAAYAFPGAIIDATDISADALAVARRNVVEHELNQRIRVRQGDLFSAVAGQTFDLIIANPPYVTAGSVAAFPPEFKAEPVLAHAGGDDGLDIVRRILTDAPRHLAPGGGLLVEIGMGRETLMQDFATLPFLWLDTETSSGEVFYLTVEDFAPVKPARKRRG